MYYLPAAVALSKLEADVKAEVSDPYLEFLSGNPHLTHIFGRLLCTYQGADSNAPDLTLQWHHLDKVVLDLVR